jgi:hypothetical protein
MIALTTTTVTVYRAAEAEPGEGRTFSVVSSRVDATITSPSGRDKLQAGGGSSVVDMVLNCDLLTDVEHTDRIVDDNTNQTFEIVWLEPRLGLGLDHTRAGLKRVEGI